MDKKKSVKSVICATDEVRRLWGDLPVTDAEHDLPIFTIEEDAKRAVRKSPEYCVFAQAVRRCYRSEHVLFLRSIAYLDLPTQKGERKVFRFLLTDAAREAIVNFDLGKTPLPEQGVLLIAPKGSRTLDAVNHKARAHRERRREAILKGAYVGKREPHKAPCKTLEMSDIRTGTGMVHFRKKKS